MKATVKLKYSKGDVVTIHREKYHYDKYTYGMWGVVPTNKEYTIDGFRIVFDNEQNEPLIQYVFHCYMDEHIDYHDLIPEDCLEAVGENHPQTIDVDVKDVFDEDINIGDKIYYGIYSHYNGKISVPAQSMAFINGGIVEAIFYCENIWNYSRYTIVYNQDFLVFANGGKTYEPNACVCKSVPDTLYKDLIDAAWHHTDYFESRYDAPKFKTLMEHFGQYELAKEYYDNLENKRLKAKAYREKRKSQAKSEPKPKKSKTAASISKDINNLSEEEKAKLLKMLLGNEKE